jgi:hypothetical protein
MEYSRFRDKPLTHKVSWVTFLIALVLTGFTIWSAFFKKTTQQLIVAKKGSSVTVTQNNKTSRFFIPFIEAGVEQQSDSKMGTYIRGGIRVEF